MITLAGELKDMMNNNTRVELRLLNNEHGDPWTGTVSAIGPDCMKFRLGDTEHLIPYSAIGSIRRLN